MVKDYHERCQLLWCKFTTLGASLLYPFNADHCWVRNVKDMSKNKVWCRN